MNETTTNETVTNEAVTNETAVNEAVVNNNVATESAANETVGANQQFGTNNAQQFGANNAQQFGANNGQQFGANNGQQFGANNGQQFGANNGQQFGANNGQQFAGGAAQFQQKEGAAAYYGKQPYVAPAEDAVANKGVAMCAYFGLLWLVPLFTAKHSPFAKFHTNQAIVLTIVSLIVNLATGIFDWVLDTISWRFYALTTVVEQLGVLFCLVLMIIGIVYAAQGKMKEIPVIGQFKILK